MSPDPEHVQVTRTSGTSATALVDRPSEPQDVLTPTTDPAGPAPSAVGRAVWTHDAWAGPRHYPGEFLG